MKKVLGTIFIILYSIIAITVTILLLSYNEYMCSEINGYTLYIVRDDSLEPQYVKGDLIAIKQVKVDEVEIGDKLYLYQNITNSDYRIRIGELTNQDYSSSRLIYDIDNEFQFDSSYLIGTEEGTVAYHHLGTILGILTSRWGYLFCIVIVTLLLFLEELYELFMEIKYGNEVEDEEEEVKPKSTKKTTTAKKSKS